MLELRPVEVPTTRPKVLLPGHNVHFSNKFPDTLDFVKGKTFKVASTIQVGYELSWMLPALHYKDINLSNEDAGEKLYPEDSDQLYEMLVGFKPGNYFTQIYFPTDMPVYKLGYYTMVPLISDAALKYLGAIKPEDSPAKDPILRLYTVYKLRPLIFRISVDNGIDYEKMTWKILINKCKLEEYSPPAGVPVKNIPYITEQSW